MENETINLSMISVHSTYWWIQEEYRTDKESEQSIGSDDNKKVKVQPLVSKIDWLGGGMWNIYGHSFAQ